MNVPVVRLVNELREKAGPALKKRRTNLGCALDERRVETFKDVWVGFERQTDKLFKLPIALFAFGELQLLGYSVKRPLQFSRRQIDSATVNIGIIPIKSKSTRTDYALVDNVLTQCFYTERVSGIADRTRLHLFQDAKLLTLKACLCPVGKSNHVGCTAVLGRNNDFGDFSNGMA